MANLFEDQAAGLRRLFAGGHGPATLAFAGIGPGRGRLLAGLARGLAAAGKEVLVIDERAGAQSVAAAFGLRSRFDLMQAVNRDVSAARVLLQAESSIRLLPAARAARQQARLDAGARRALAEWLSRLQKEADFVLADTVDCAGSDASPLLPQPQRVIVALPPDAQSITEAYARMKRLAQQRGCRRFGVVILCPEGSTPGVRAGAEEGRTAFANLCAVARRHLGAELELLGDPAARSDPHDIGQALAETFLDPLQEAAEAVFPAFARPAPGPAPLHPVV